MAIGKDFPQTLAEVDHPIVGLIMGSDSDARFLVPAEVVLEEFGVPHEARVVSAHRTPDWMHSYAEDARGRGLLHIIAAAGGSAHLPGMTASETVLPVTGVAIESSADPLSAAFGSMLRMPADGGPLVTAGKNEAGATNAALHVVRCLAPIFPELVPKLSDRMEGKAAEVMAKDARMRALGIRGYLDGADRI